MDDPKHIEARREKIDNLRRWERTKSYTFGDRATAGESAKPTRPSSISAPGSFTAAKSSARPAPELATLAEHHQEDTSFNSEGDSSFDFAGSPCGPKYATIRPAKPVISSKASAPLPRRTPLGRASTVAALNFGFPR